MIKKTLEQKIKQVGYWTFCGVFWYLVVAFFLKSDYPIYEQPFNHKDAYEVIKDALTIVATVSAPLVAYLLYSDWKEPYYETIKDSAMTEIFNLIFYILKDLYHLKLELSSTYIDDFKDKDNHIFDNLIKLEHSIKRLERLGFGQSEFVVNVNETLKNLRKLKENMRKLAFQQAKLKNLMASPYNFFHEINQCQALIDNFINDSDSLFKKLEDAHNKMNEWKIKNPE